MVHCHISQTTSATDDQPMVPLPSPPSQTPLIPPIINSNPSQSGDAFGRRGYRTNHQSTDNSVGHILAVSINGQS